MRGSVRREGAAARVKAKPLGDEGTFFFFITVLNSKCKGLTSLGEGFGEEERRNTQRKEQYFFLDVNNGQMTPRNHAPRASVGSSETGSSSKSYWFCSSFI